MQPIDQVALESRLVHLEESLRSGFAGVHGRLDTLNGQVGRNTSWRIEHQQAHAVDAGRVEERARLRRGDWAILTGLLGAAGVVSGIVFKILEAWG